MSGKNNPLKRFKLLCEYTFIDQENLYPKKDDSENILHDDEEIDLSQFSENPLRENDEDIESDEMPGQEDGDISPDELSDMDSEIEGDVSGGEVEPAVEPMDGMGEDDMEEPSGDEVEVDVTDIIQNSDEVKQITNDVDAKMDDLLNKIDNVLSASTQIDQIAQRLDGLEKEIIKRNPTNVEKLELQSLHSAPYNQKLQDYWSDKMGDYAVDAKNVNTNINFDEISQSSNNQPEELTATQQDIEDTYSETSVKDSFEYEEEDVDDYNV